MELILNGKVRGYVFPVECIFMNCCLKEKQGDLGTAGVFTTVFIVFLSFGVISMVAFL